MKLMALICCRTSKNHYNPANATDVQNIADDTTPASLKYDTLHPSQTLMSGALYVGQKLTQISFASFSNIKDGLNNG
ncbi:Uncharacterised protein [Klebsiella pneumoniae]|uniref:hypothetical protein n=1 Tax=Klebsiella pneumoniae TaxID=573 RepID=UPI000F6DBE86|nr:hypothetical protein [Klebsiella pneumoniae]VED90878.1 Uncharacterised protein [Klebsiella pneumoniae]